MGALGAGAAAAGRAGAAGAAGRAGAAGAAGSAGGKAAAGVDLDTISRLFQSATKIADGFTGAFDGVNKALDDACGKANQMGADLARVTLAFTGVTTAARIASAGVDAFVGTIRQTVTRFVEAFDPGTVQLFELAVKDLNATLGRALRPALELAIHIVKRLGDAFAAFEVPAGKIVAVAAKIFDAFAPVIDEFVRFANEVSDTMARALEDSADELQALGQVLTEIARLLATITSASISAALQFLSSVLEVVTPLLLALAEGLREVADAVGEFLRDIGLISKTKGEPKIGTGMAAHSANFESAQSYSQFAYKSAYGMGAEMSAAEKTNTKLDTLISTVEGFKTMVANGILNKFAPTDAAKENSAFMSVRGMLGTLRAGWNDEGESGGHLAAHKAPPPTFNNWLSGRTPTYWAGRIGRWAASVFD